MGNNQTSTQQTHTFVQTYIDSNFGQCNIYKNNFHSNQFVVGIDLNVPHQKVHMVEQSLKQFKSNYLLQQDNCQYLKIVDWKCSLKDDLLGSSKIISTCNVPSMTIWVQFLRHNLRDFSAWRRDENQPFSFQEITMAVYKAITAYELTKNNSLLGPSLELQDISVTIEGEMKFNSLLGKKLTRQLVAESSSSAFKKGQISPLKDRIVQRRAFNEKRETSQTKYINLSMKQEDKCSQYSSQESRFLQKLKKFACQLSRNCVNQKINCQNPQEAELVERREIKNLINQIMKARTLKEVKTALNQPSLDAFFVDFSKLRHQKSQAKFQRILSEMQSKSQRTDYSAYQSPIKQSVSQRPVNFSMGYMTPTHYHY